MKAIFPETPQDWTNTKSGKIYYNSKTGQYTSTILTDVQVIPDEQIKEKASKYYEAFILNICSNLNKGIGQKDLSDKIVILGKYIDPSPLMREKLLFGINASEFDSLRELAPSNAPDLLEVVYNLNTFFTKLENIAEKFKDYQSQYIADIFKDSSNAFQNVDFLMESEGLYKFGDNLKSLVEANDLSLSNYSRMQISFNGTPSIVDIILSKEIDSVRLKYLLTEYISSYPQNNEQTVVFITRLSELEEDIKSNFQNYQTIVEKYFLNKRKKERRSTNIISRSGDLGKSFSVKNSDVEVEFASLKEINNRSVKLLQKEILNSVYRTPCMTPEEKDRIDAKLEREEGKKANFANKLSLSVSDAFFQNLPEVLEKVATDQGDEALKSLGRNFLNRMGVCGIGDLTSLVMNTVFAYMDEQEYADELSKCAVENLNNDKVSKLWQEVQRLGVNAEILERYRKFVGDTIPPWNTAGYIPPDYRKDLDTDDAISEKYTLKIKTPMKDTDIDFRFTAFRNSIAASVKGEDLLNILVNTFPDEMGWLNFFTDMTKGILNKCKVPMPNIGVSFESNWCQKRVNLPELEDIPKSNASFTFKPSDIGTILVEELKNIIINLTVRTVISSMRQVFQIIAAGASFDGDYFKQRQYIPDLFQNENTIQTDIYNFCNDTTSNFRVVNESVRTIFQDKYPLQYSVSPLSLEDVDTFLKSCSVALGRYDKIRLYRGEAEETVYQKVIELASDTNISQFLRSYSEIDQFFLSLGQLMDVNEIESGFYDEVRQPAPTTISYCGEDFDSLGMAYARNKPEISDKQIEEMKNTLKDIQKDKICFAVNTVGNPQGAVIGQVGEMIKSKTGPIFSRIAAEMGKMFEPVIENQIRVASKNYRNDLYNSKGLFDLILVDQFGVGKNRRQLQSFFGATLDDPSISGLINSKITSSQYSPIKSSNNVSVSFAQGTGIKYKEQKNELEIASDDSVIIPTEKYEGEFESGANRVQYLLEKNQDILRDSLNQKVSRNFISNGVLSSIVEEYFEDMQSKLLASPRTYVGNWQKIYSAVERNEEYVGLILGEEKIIKDTKDLYGLLENVEQEKSYIPFRPLKSKEEIAIAYASFSLLVNTVSSEILLKSLPVYEAFGADLLNDYEMLGDYIYQKFESTIDNFSNDRRRLKTLEKLVQVSFTASNEGIIPPFSAELQANIDKININIKNWVSGEKGNRKENLERNEKDMESIAKFFVKSVSKQYIREFQKNMSVIEGNTFPSINKTDTIYNYIFNESLLSSVNNVVSDVDKSGELEKGLTLEKYIMLKGASSGLPSGVQNLDDFKDYLRRNPLEGNISDHWESWSFGIRISSIFDFSKADADISLSSREQMKGFTLISDSDSTETEKYFLSPLVVYEKPIPDTEINSKIVDEYNDASMKKDLSEIDDFLNFYYRGMNIENLISLTTIYIDEEFGNFLSNNPNPTALFDSTVTNWQDKGEKVLNDTKRFIVNTLEKI